MARTTSPSQPALRPYLACATGEVLREVGSPRRRLRTFVGGEEADGPPAHQNTASVSVRERRCEAVGVCHYRPHAPHNQLRRGEEEATTWRSS
jgi:hypothetical protein